MPFALQLMDGQRSGEILPIVSDSLTIGRSSGDLLLEDTEVSGRHCSLQMSSGELQVVDHASRNGTFLNGKRVERSRLSAGDSLRVGSVVFRVVEWPAHGDFQNPLGLLKTWCGRLITEEKHPSAEAFAKLLEKEIDLCVNDLQLKLTIESKDGRVLNHLVPAREVILGRSGPVPLLAEDEETSRKHAKVFIGEDGEVEVEDLESANGTFVNEVRLNGRRKLLPGDVVRLGKTEIRVACLIAEFSRPIQL